MNTDLIPFSYFNIQETDQFGRFVSHTLAAEHPEDPWIPDLVADLTDPLKKTQQAIGSSTKLQETEAIQGADTAVDTSFRGFVKVIMGYQLSPVAAESAAANVLMPLIEQNNKRLYRMGYDEQSARLNSLFTDLEGEDAKQALEALGLTTWLTTLKAQLKALEDLRKARTNTSATTETPTDREAKSALREAIEFVLSDINTLIRRNKVPGLEETDKKIEAKALEIAAIARARKTRQENKSSEDNKTE